MEKNEKKKIIYQDYKNYVYKIINIKRISRLLNIYIFYVIK